MIPQPKDLRIGNIVLMDGREIEVLTIDESGINYETYWEEMDWDYHYSHQKYGSNYKTMVGLPLCPVILARCGFVMLNHRGKLQPTLSIDTDTEINFQTDGKNWICCIALSQDNYDENINLSGFTVERSLPHIKYLHQLQNFLFDMFEIVLSIVPIVPVKEPAPITKGTLSPPCELLPERTINAIKASVCKPAVAPCFPANEFDGNEQTYKI